MHPKKDRNRNVRIVEEINSSRREIEEAEQVSRHHSRHGHGGHAKEELSRQTNQKQHQVHVGWIELGNRDLGTPRDPGGARQEQRYRKHRERECRWVENVRAASIPVPLEQLL